MYRNILHITNYIFEAPLLLLLMVFIVACDQQEIETLHDSSSCGVPLQLSSGIGVHITRAYDSSWDSNDKIGVFTTGAGTYTITKSGTLNDENIPYVVTSGAETNGNNYLAFTPVDNKIFVPADGSKIDVYAYYPYTANVSESSPLSITIPTSQTSDNQKSVDVLSAINKTTESNPIDIDHTTVQLLFHHVLSKVLIKVVTGEGYSKSDVSSVSVVMKNQPTNATFAPFSQTLTISSDSKTEIVPVALESGNADYDANENVVKTFRAIILPNNDSSNPVYTSDDVNQNPNQLKFMVGSVAYYYPITHKFLSGEQTTFTITLAATGISINAAIMDWSYESITPSDPIYDVEQ